MGDGAEMEGLELRRIDTYQPEATYGRRTRTTRALKGYEVYRGAEFLGSVREEMMTFDVGPRGRAYVTRRWSSPRWFAYVGQSRRRGLDRVTRGQAVEDVVDGYAALLAQSEGER